MLSELLHNRNRPAVSVANLLNFVANRPAFRQNRTTSRCHERIRETLSGSARKIVNQTRGFNLMDRKLIAVAVSSALALPMAAYAVEGSVSGQVNRAVIIESQDGHPEDGNVQHVDNNSSETQFRFTGSEDMGNGWTAGVRLELGRPDDWRTRRANVYLSGAGGKLTIGLAAQAADGMAHADLGGAAWLGGATNWCSYQSDTSSPACPSNDGGRSDVLKYDTPALGPVNLSASMGDGDYWDAQAKASGSMGDSGYDIRVGYIDTSETITASGAFSMGQGTSVAIAWSQQDTTDHEYQYVKLDHSYGDGSVAAYYKRGEKAGLEGALWGVGVGHGLGGGATAYAGFRFIDADNAEDMNLFVAGMLVTFN